MKLLKGDWQDLNECLDFLMKFIISDDISSDLDGNLWHTTTLELNLILSSSFKAHLNTQSYSGIAKYITHFLNNSLKKTYERFQTLISTKGKMLYTRASNCAQLIWLSVNLLKYFDDDDEIFDKTQAFKWVQILDKCFELQQLSTKETGRFPMVQLTGLMFIMFVLKNKIIRHTIKG
nr:unknown [Schistosoma japonicum]